MPPQYQSNRVELLYATDRKIEERDDATINYGYRRSHSLAIGACTVTIGKDVSWDQLVRQSSIKRRSVSLSLAVAATKEITRFPATGSPLVEIDGRLVDDPAVAKQREDVAKQLQQLISDRLALTDRKEVFLFIHGYNNSFEQAVFRMAQLWHFLGRQGVAVAYSWPAGHPGLLRGYTYDRESGEFSVLHLRNFLRAVASCPDLEKLHIVAHSRGTDVLMTALRELHIQFKAAGHDMRGQLKLGNVVLAAADLDWEVTIQRISAERLVVVPERFTIYLSDDDKALGLSGWLFSSMHRLGTLLESDLTKAQHEALRLQSDLNVIDVKATTGFLGHGYFIENPAVLSDLILVLRDDRDPGKANGRPLARSSGGFWDLFDGYPAAAADRDER